MTESFHPDRRRLMDLHTAEVMMPSAHDPELFSFWLATLMDRRPLEKLQLLKLRDTRERITCGLVYLKSRVQGRQFG